MKKLVATIASLTLLTGTVIGFNAQTPVETASATGKTGFAYYVSTSNAPIIDGMVDEIWDTAETSMETPTVSDGTVGTVKILWDTTGLYYLVQVNDPNLCADDQVGFWVAENAVSISGADKKSYYSGVDGAYHLQFNIEGQEMNNNVWDCWGEIDMTGKYTFAVTTNENGYVMELYVPLFGKFTTLTVGEYIGFNLHIDAFKSDGNSTSKIDWVYWNTDVPDVWWDKPAYLGDIQLVNTTSETPPVVERPTLPEDSSSPEVPTTSESPITSEVPTTSEKPISSETSTTSEAPVTTIGKKGCSSIIGGVVCGISALTLSAVALLKKKEN